MSQAEVQHWQIGWLALIVQAIMLIVLCWWHFTAWVYLSFVLAVVAGISLGTAMRMRMTRLGRD